MEKGYKKIFALFFIVILLTVNFTTVFAEEIKNDDYIENNSGNSVDVISIDTGISTRNVNRYLNQNNEQNAIL